MGVSAIVWGMEKLKGVVSLVSNSPNLATGYGVQCGLLVEKMKQAGLQLGMVRAYDQAMAAAMEQDRRKADDPGWLEGWRVR